jgi:ABC-type phosphate transport system substrate-binding protein
MSSGRSARTARHEVGGGFLRRVKARSLPLLATAALAAAVVGTADATGPFVVIVNASVIGTNVRRADLAAVFLKKSLRWGDGSPASPVDQSSTSPVRRGFSETVLQMPVMAVVQYWGRQLASPAASVRLPAVKESDEDVLVYVSKTSGAVGYVSTGTALPTGVKAVTIIE